MPGNFSSSKIRAYSGSHPQHSQQERKRERENMWTKSDPQLWLEKVFTLSFQSQIQPFHAHQPDILYTGARWPWQLQITYEFQFSFDKRQSWSSSLNPIFFSFSEKAVEWKCELAQTRRKKLFSRWILSPARKPFQLKLLNKPLFCSTHI